MKSNIHEVTAVAAIIDRRVCSRSVAAALDERRWLLTRARGGAIALWSFCAGIGVGMLGVTFAWTMPDAVTRVVVVAVIGCAAPQFARPVIVRVIDRWHRPDRS